MDLLGVESGEDRESQTLLRSPFRLRKVARLVSEIGKALLKMKRHRIVDGAADFLLGKAGLNGIPLPITQDADHILVIDMVIAQAACSKGF